MFLSDAVTADTQTSAITYTGGQRRKETRTDS